MREVQRFVPERRQEEMAVSSPFTDAVNSGNAHLCELLAQAAGPVLIVSTKVGRGMYSLGEAIAERIPAGVQIKHVDIECLLPSRGRQEDLDRYRAISSNWPWLLNLVYRIPIFYYRKYLRERLSPADLNGVAGEIERVRPRTVICVSHRPTFWMSALKSRSRTNFELWGVLGELGDTLGWRYLFWNAIDRFLSPVPATELSCRLSEHTRFTPIALPARRAYEQLRGVPPDPHRILVVCGYWGQGPVVPITQQLLKAMPDSRVDVVCGENAELNRLASRTFRAEARVTLHGCVATLLPLMRECAAVVTKPGISTLLEAHAAGRKIFLLRGMPVAEDNNARFASRYFGAEWFHINDLCRWSASEGLR
jgi:hypothetical protein